MKVEDIKKIKTRFAPSPTGSLHVGGIRTALFNYFLARAQKGIFMLRIEDTDQQRKVEGAEEQIKESLEWLGVNWDEFVVQSQRLGEYKKYAEKLLTEGKAKEDNGAIRFIVSKEGKTEWNDAIGQKVISFENIDIEDFIILKKDGYPTYHLASIVDDHMMNITHVIRGEDWISSTPKHIMLYKALGWEVPIFAHVPNVFGTDGKKLSKRRGAKSALDYRKEGILSEALLNYLMLLGWSPKNDHEIFEKEEIEKEFTLENINSSPAIFDEKKLLWVNGEHIRLLTTESLKEKLLEFDPALSEMENFTKYIPLAQTRMKTLSEFKDMVEDVYGIELSDKQRQLAHFLLDKYKSISNWNAQEILQASFAARDMSGAKTQDLYLVLTGKIQGLPFAEKLEIEGKDATIKKLQ
jgi:glutamyl-tRNA synthetase